MRREEPLPPDAPFCSIFGTCIRQPDVTAAHQMLKTLRTSASAYLGTSFCFVDIAVPENKKTYQTDILASAVKAIGLCQPRITFDAARTAVGYREERDTIIPENQIVLAIDYSNAGLGLDLICNNEGIIENLREEHHVGLGASDTSPSHWEDVVAALRYITQSPLPLCSFEDGPHDYIDYVVLYGDSTTNEGLKYVLDQVLGDELIERARKADPEFKVALAVAESSYDVQNEIDFRGKAAFGCRWRSGLYSGQGGDL